jgi:hypothetical protein
MTEKERDMFRGPITIKGIWRSEWFDTPEQGVLAAQKVEKERIYDEQKLVFSMQNYLQQKEQQRAQKEAIRLLRERQDIESMIEEDVEEEAKKVILWN